MNLEFLTGTLEGVQKLATQQVVNLSVDSIRSFTHAFPVIAKTFDYVCVPRTSHEEVYMPDLSEFLSSYPTLTIPRAFSQLEGYPSMSSEYANNLAIIVYAESEGSERVFDMKLLCAYMQKYNILQAKLRAAAYTNNLLAAATWQACFTDAFNAADFDLSLNPTRLLYVVEQTLVRNKSGMRDLTAHAVVVMCAGSLNQRFSQREYDTMVVLVAEALSLSPMASFAKLNRID